MDLRASVSCVYDIPFPPQSVTSCASTDALGAHLIIVCNTCDNPTNSYIFGLIPIDAVAKFETERKKNDKQKQT